MSHAGTSTIGGRAGGLVLLALGVALVAATVPDMAAHIAMAAGDGTMIGLRRGAAPPSAALRSAIFTRDAALGWRNFAQPQADKAALYFELASRTAEMPRDSSGNASAQYRNAVLDRSITLHRSALGQGPARPYAWLRLAQAQYLRDPGGAKLDPLLRQSYLTAPAEPQLALQRIKLVFAARHLVGQGFDEMVSRDIRLVVRYRPGFLSEFARERFALPWLREKLRSDPDLEARFIGDYLKLPSP